MRNAATTSGSPNACLPEGTAASIDDGPREADGYTWWHLRGQGWAVSQYLAVQGGSPASPQAAAPAGAAPVADDPQTVVRTFYDWYVAETNKGTPRRYIRPDLVGRPELSAAIVPTLKFSGGTDPIVCMAQDFPESVSVSPGTVSGTTALVNVAINNMRPPNQHTVELTLDSGRWVISKIDCRRR